MATISTDNESKTANARESSAPLDAGPAGGAAGAGDAREDALRLSRALTDFIRVVQFRDRDRACCYGLSVSQCYALKAVVDAGALTVNELAGELYLDKSTASRVVTSLERKGLVRRERAEDDGRVVLLTATGEGHRLHKRIEGDLALEYGTLMQGLPPETRAAMIELLGRLASVFAARVDASGGRCCVID